MHGTFLHQKVNSYLCIALVSLMAFWTCLYYFVNRTEALGNSFASAANVSDLK